MTVSTEKTMQGAWRVSAIVGGYLVSMQYMGYTKRKAVAMFKEQYKGAKHG